MRYLCDAAGKASLRAGLAMMLLLAVANAFAVTPTALALARDLVSDGRIAKAEKRPIIILVSLAGCPYCETVLRSHLLPLLNNAMADSAPLIRQVEINGNEVMTDFAGRQITHAEFARRFNVRLAPVVFFFGPDGSELADPLVGAMIPDFYGAYFDAALAKATDRMRSSQK